MKKTFLYTSFAFLLLVPSCDKDDSFAICVENNTNDTIFVLANRAAYALTSEMPNGVCCNVDNYKVIMPSRKTIIWDNGYSIDDAYKIYVVRKNNGNNFLEHPELPMAFDYSHVFNYDDLKHINFCITIRDTDLQGRRLTTIPAKGLYIQNGRKRVVK